MNMHKVKYISLLILVILLSLPACVNDSSNEAKHDTSSNAQEKTMLNSITFYQFNDDEQALVDLIEMSNKVNIFNYELKDEFNYVQFWIREYRDGVLCKEDHSIPNKIKGEKQYRGKIAVIEENSRVRVAYKTTNSAGSSTFDLLDRYEYEGGAWNYSLPLRHQQELVDGEEVNLWVYATSKDATSIAQPQMFTANPELIKNYDSLYLVSCKFFT